MAMFTAYFDASGNGVDQPHVVVSGYIASYLQWKLIDGAWRNYHKARGVELPFHAADLMAAISNPNYKNQTNARQDYVHLAENRRDAEDFVVDLSALELTMVNCAITAIVPMGIYKGVSSLLELREVVPPYALAARMCIDLVRQWEHTFGVSERVECIFEEGDFEQGKFTKLIIDEGMPVPIYKKKIEFVGLQPSRDGFSRFSSHKSLCDGQAVQILEAATQVGLDQVLYFFAHCFSQLIVHS